MAGCHVTDRGDPLADSASHDDRLSVDVVSASGPAPLHPQTTEYPHAATSVFITVTGDRPVLADGDSNRLFHGQKRPERRVALTPEAFVEQNNLIRNMQLDVAATRQCFMAQLGQPLTTWKDMAPHEKALFAVFGLQFFLGDRKSAVSLMNNLNLSCRLKSKRDQGVSARQCIHWPETPLSGS